MPKITDKLNLKQVIAIPIFLNKKEYTIKMVADRYKVSEQAIYYWIKQLRQRGVEIKVRKQGQTSLLAKRGK